MAGFGGRGRRRAMVAAGVVAVVASLLWSGFHLARGALGPADVAAVIGVPLGVLAVVLGLRRPPVDDLADQARAAATTLAAQILAAEGPQLRLLLGDDTERINLRYTLVGGPRPARTPAGGGHLLNGDDDGASMLDIATYYRSTRPRRLVVTGEAGAGKTTLAMELMLALIEERELDDPVPVRLSVGEWDTAVSLEDHLTAYLVRAYQWSRGMAAQLVGQRLVLPVLDGLDEMDPTLPNGSPDPEAVRARAALQALNRYQDGRDAAPLVLTCRTGHYDALGHATHLVKAAHIAIEPVEAADAQSYLAARTADPTRWQPLLDTLSNHPHGVLSRSLSTPWRLCLAATVYAEEGDPADLLAHPSPDSLDQHLLARYIAAATKRCPSPGYAPEEVHGWLHHLATHLAAQGADPTPDNGATGTSGGPGTDLILHRLWPLAGARQVRTLHTVLTTGLFLVACAGPAMMLRVPASLIGLVVAAALEVALGAASSDVRPPRRPNWQQLRGRRIVQFLGLGMVLSGVVTAINALIGTYLGGFAGGALGGTVGGLGGQIAPTLGYGVFGGLAMGLYATVDGPPSPAARPGEVLRDDFLWSLAFALLLGAASGTAFGLTDGPAAGTVAALVIAVWGTVGLSMSGARPGQRYLAFVICSRLRAKTPLRLRTFLDWATRAGILRKSGPAYQFRHRELQHWVAEHPVPADSR
ncbi:NACHT domain-containing protein [Streptomyces sp. NPDC093568]|uniref:NACHT domain-containing protein n=1 Tax=Streptomyces sp. NPDC093568 TaxID=3366041 RepID=UPI00381A0756